eukprot:5979418-Pyramimonas_sp.AAC.1
MGGRIMRMGAYTPIGPIHTHARLLAAYSCMKDGCMWRSSWGGAVQEGSAPRSTGSESCG